MPLPADVYLEIVTLSQRTEHLTLARLSWAFNRLLNPVIYRLNYVKSNVKKFVHSLASNPRLPRLVLKLIFEESPETYVDVEEWAAVLPAMVNLHYISVVPTIPLSRHVLPLLTFRLWGFGATGDVVGPWAELVASQPQLEELRLDSDYFGVIPGPTQLPRLRLIKGRPADIARCAQHKKLKQLWFFTGPPFGQRSLKAADLALLALSPARLLDIRIYARYFLQLLDAAPQMLTTLRHIVLDEELDWSDFTLDPHAPVGNSIKNFAAALTRERFPQLQSVLLICARKNTQRGARRLLSRADGAHFLDSFKMYLTGPRFRSLRLFAFDGCMGFDNWGSAVQPTTYLGPPPNQGPIDFEWCLVNLDLPTWHHYCHTCIVCQHSSYPVHRIRRWDGFYYNDEIAASALGLSLRLAHGEDSRCTVPIVERNVPVLTSESGILKIDIEFCGCNPLASRRLQLIAVGMSPSVVSGVPGATELRWFFREQDRREETARRRRESARRRIQSLKPHVEPLPVLPPIPPRKHWSLPSRAEGPANRAATEFTEEQQASWDAMGNELAATALAWREGKLGDGFANLEEEDHMPTFEEFLARTAPPVPLPSIPGLWDVVENVTAGYVQLLACVKRLRKADEERTKAFELLTSLLWQKHETTFKNWYGAWPTSQGD
ncbi:hypothetical protein B0H16DRAFT_1455094 [Mycena metata]|uniref:CxC2-like cysteine cluster KDZ transposase-associated domain-containing protein n=1 Tax=Mycena metata TaxID=1033252 RepID=A0AAD7JJ56_9AGAR|nr:hypothetical protein B0H16DRAFT_1455094 [Mycena metata]